MAVAVAQPAAAGTIVYDGGTDIWAMRDDGTGARVLISKAATPGMTLEKDSIGSPDVARAGTAVAFTGSTNRFRTTRTGQCGTYPYYYTCFTFHSGYNGTGIYTWRGGAPVRHSPQPAPCFNCTHLDSSPSFSGDGTRLLSALNACSGFTDQRNFTCTGGIAVRNFGAPAASFPTACETSFPEAAINPADRDRVAYLGCDHPDDATYAAVITTGPAKAGQRAVACDDAEASSLDWSTDGTRLAVAEGGETPGIWTYPAAGDACNGGEARHVLKEPDGVSFDDVTYAANDRILFSAQDNVWSVPAGCDGCAFPASAKQLTSNGTSTSPSWSSVPLERFAAAAAQGAPSPRAAPALTLGGKARQALRKRTLKVTCASNVAATCTAVATVKLGKKKLKSKRASKAVPAGKRVTLKLTFSKKNAKKIRASLSRRRKLKASVAIAIKDGAGLVSKGKRTVRLLR